MSLATRFKDLSVSTKVVSAFAFVLIATVALGIFSVQRLTQVHDNAEDMRSHWLQGTRILGEMQYAATRYRSWNGAYLEFTTEELRQQGKQNFVTLEAAVAESLAKYKALAQSDDERGMADKIGEKWAAYTPMLNTELGIDESKGQTAAVNYYMGPMMAAFTAVKNEIDGAIAYNANHANQVGTAGETTFESARLWIFTAIGLAILMCLGAGFTLIRAVSSPLVMMTDAMGQLATGKLDVHVPNADQHDEIGKLAEAMTSFKNQLAAAERSKAEQTQTIVSSIGAGLDALAKGDLTHRVSSDLNGPFVKLKDDFNAAMSRLQETMKTVLASTDGISTGAGEISQASDDLSRRTEQQAASLEETAAALEEITATVKKTAANTKEASASVTTAKSAAEEGGHVVETAIKAMGEIEQSSKQITDIIGVIDEIAFQTNLLALNAGVEAARAGDAGKGFAVVASEVRALAQRSSEAAKEIKTLIKASGEHVGAGVKYVGETGQALKRIVDQVVQINALVTEMAQAAEQQSTGIEQVNVAVSQMDQVTQQNAAMVEESTAAVRNLAGETQALSNLVAFFKVGAEARAALQAPRSQATTQPAAKPVAKARPLAVARPAGGSARRAATALAQRPETESEDWTEF